MINFHQRIMQFRGEMKEKDGDQDSICITSIFHQNVKDLPRHMVMEYSVASRRRKGSRMDQKWKQYWLVRAFRRGGARFRPKELKHDQIAPRTSSTRREDHSSSVRAANHSLRAAYTSRSATRPDLRVQVFSKLNLISLIIF